MYVGTRKTKNEVDGQQAWHEQVRFGGGRRPRQRKMEECRTDPLVSQLDKGDDQDRGRWRSVVQTPWHPGWTRETTKTEEDGGVSYRSPGIPAGQGRRPRQRKMEECRTDPLASRLDKGDDQDRGRWRSVVQTSWRPGWTRETTKTEEDGGVSYRSPGIPAGQGRRPRQRKMEECRTDPLASRLDKGDDQDRGRWRSVVQIPWHPGWTRETTKTGEDGGVSYRPPGVPAGQGRRPRQGKMEECRTDPLASQLDKGDDQDRGRWRSVVQTPWHPSWTRETTKTGEDGGVSYRPPGIPAGQGRRPRQGKMEECRTGPLASRLDKRVEEMTHN